MIVVIIYRIMSDRMRWTGRGQIQVPSPDMVLPNMGSIRYYANRVSQ